MLTIAVVGTAKFVLSGYGEGRSDRSYGQVLRLCLTLCFGRVERQPASGACARFGQDAQHFIRILSWRSSIGRAFSLRLNATNYLPLQIEDPVRTKKTEG